MPFYIFYQFIETSVLSLASSVDIWIASVSTLLLCNLPIPSFQLLPNKFITASTIVLFHNRSTSYPYTLMSTPGSILFRTLMLLLYVAPQCFRMASTVHYPGVTYSKPITLFDCSRSLSSVFSHVSTPGPSSSSWGCPHLFSYPQNGSNESTYLIRLLWGLNTLIHKVHWKKTLAQNYLLLYCWAKCLFYWGNRSQSPFSKMLFLVQKDLVKWVKERKQ